MISFAKEKFEWLNMIVKNTNTRIKNKITSNYLESDNTKNHTKNTDINVLLNRVRLNQKNESRKKIYFSTVASAGLLLFGLVIFQ